MDNLKSLNFSPYLWWKAIEKAKQMVSFYGKELFEGFDFDKWIKLEDLRILKEPGQERNNGLEIEKNLCYKVGMTNQLGAFVTARDVEELKAMPFNEIGPTTKLTFFYKIEELVHLTFSYLNLWLVLGDKSNKANWTYFLDFVCINSEKHKSDLYRHFWVYIFNDIVLYKNQFQPEVADELVALQESFNIETSHVEKAWIDKRDKVKG